MLKISALIFLIYIKYRKFDIIWIKSLKDRILESVRKYRDYLEREEKLQKIESWYFKRG